MQSDHPIVTGQSHVATITAEAPRYPAQARGGNVGLESDLRSMGLKFERTKGKYGGHENSYFVHGARPEQMMDLGHRYGQEAVVLSGPEGRHLMFTNGPHIGHGHPAKGVPHVQPQEPDDYWTALPKGGFVQIDFDTSKLEPLVSAPQQQVQHQPVSVSKAQIGHGLYKVLTKALEDAGIPTAR